MSLKTPENQPKTPAEIIGDNLKFIRNEKLQVTLSDLSKHLQRYGVHWSTGRLSGIENHSQKTISLDTVLILTLGLTTISQNVTVTFKQLLDGRCDVLLAPELLIKRENWSRFLENGEIPDVTVKEGPNTLLSLNRAMEALRGPSSATLRSLAEVDFALADQRAARKLSITKDEFIDLSLKLWGSLMSERTEELATPADSAQKKGRITRELIEEMRVALEEGKNDGNAEN